MIFSSLNRSRMHLPKRSEEHTSELQSQSNLVCRLLLEKKKNSQNYRAPTAIKQPTTGLGQTANTLSSPPSASASPSDQTVPDLTTHTPRTHPPCMLNLA